MFDSSATYRNSDGSTYTVIFSDTPKHREQKSQVSKEFYDFNQSLTTKEGRKNT